MTVCDLLWLGDGDGGISFVKVKSCPLFMYITNWYVSVKMRSHAVCKEQNTSPEFAAHLQILFNV